MKKAFMALLAMLTLTVAAFAQDNDVRLSMTFRNEQLSSVLLRLEKSSDYKFLFTFDDVEKYRLGEGHEIHGDCGLRAPRQAVRL